MKCFHVLRAVLWEPQKSWSQHPASETEPGVSVSMARLSWQRLGWLVESRAGGPGAGRGVSTSGEYPGRSERAGVTAFSSLALGAPQEQCAGTRGSLWSLIKCFHQETWELLRIRLFSAQPTCSRNGRFIADNKT